MSKRTPFLAAALAVALGGGSGVARAAPVRPGAHAGAALVACHPGLTPGDRYATFSARMSLLAGAASMAVRFDMSQRTRQAPWHRVTAPGLAVWHPSVPGIVVFSYNQSVTNLPAPAGFRVQVSFRWRDAQGHVIRRARRRSGVCQLADVRPHLALDSITRQPTTDRAITDYRVTVTNRGLSPASAFDVGLTVDGAPQPSLGVPGLAPGETRQLDFLGPRCRTGGSFTVAADPERRIDQSTHADSTRTVSC
ncbi:MAG: hypothetical protein E6G56_03330 [Actinobacteria bacterium]|nr:MAG: hypothetical protein E6G56_03330 [Actinomycetota bacterium]